MVERRRSEKGGRMSGQEDRNVARTLQTFPEYLYLQTFTIVLCQIALMSPLFIRLRAQFHTQMALSSRLLLSCRPRARACSRRRSIRTLSPGPAASKRKGKAFPTAAATSSMERPTALMCLWGDGAPSKGLRTVVFLFGRLTARVSMATKFDCRHLARTGDSMSVCTTARSECTRTYAQSSAKAWAVSD